MTLDFVSSMSSDIFELIAEKDARFFVHKDILAAQSKPFKEATSGEWKEATERKINLKDWDGDTVGRMVQFLYTGDYRYPDPEPLTPTPATTKRPESPMDFSWREDQQPDIDLPLTPLNECLEHILPPPRKQPLTDRARLESFDPASCDFKNALLSHAKVYALAHYKSINALRTLALERLLMTLSKINPVERGSHIALNIVDLASYVYANTDQLIHSEEPLRKLVSQFTALNFRALQSEPEALELLGRGGDFVKEVLVKVCRRLPDTQIGVYHRAQRGAKFVSRIRIDYQAYDPSSEPNLVCEVQGGDTNVNYPYEPVSFIQEFTDNPSDACTMFQVTYNRPSNTSKNITRERGLSYYLKEVRAKGIIYKITEVALFRSVENNLDITSIRGYSGMTNIKENWGEDDYLYLVWKSVKTPPI